MSKSCSHPTMPDQSCPLVAICPLIGAKANALCAFPQKLFVAKGGKAVQGEGVTVEYRADALLADDVFNLPARKVVTGGQCLRVIRRKIGQTALPNGRGGRAILEFVKEPAIETLVHVGGHVRRGD